MCVSVDCDSLIIMFCQFPSPPALQVCLKKLRGIRLPSATALALIGNLGLSPDDIHTLPSSLERICSIWISKETNPFIDVLIQALILTKSTGRYAALLSSSKGYFSLLKGYMLNV